MSKPNAVPIAAIILSTLAVLFSGLALHFATGVLNAERPVSRNFEAHARHSAPRNLDVPPYAFLDDIRIRIG